MLPLLPSRRLATMVAIAGLAFLFDTTFALLLDGAILIFTLFDAVAAWREPAPQMERVVPARIALAGTAEIVMQLHNSAARGMRVSWTDDPGPGLTRVLPDVLSAVIPARSGERATYRVRAADR